MYLASIQDLIVELNRALGALRITYPNLTRGEALQDSVVIEEYWEELYELDANAAVSWLQVEDTDLTREIIFEGARTFDMATIGRALDYYQEDAADE